MKGFSSGGVELSRQGRTNLQAAIRCMLIAAVGTSIGLAQDSVAQESPAGIPTLDRVVAQGYQISRVPLPPPRVSVNIGPLLSMNPNTIAYFLDGVRQDSFLGYDTSQPDPVDPTPTPMPNPQPNNNRCGSMDDKAPVAVMNNP